MDLLCNRTARVRRQRQLQKLLTLVHICLQSLIRSVNNFVVLIILHSIKFRFSLCSEYLARDYLMVSQIQFFENKYNAETPRHTTFDIIHPTSPVFSCHSFAAAKPSRRPVKPGDIGWGLKLSESHWFRNDSRRVKVLVTFSSLKAQCTLLYFLLCLVTPVVS